MVISRDLTEFIDVILIVTVLFLIHTVFHRPRTTWLISIMVAQAQRVKRIKWQAAAATSVYIITLYST